MQGYNAQAVVSEEQIIVAVGVTQEANDVQQLLVFEGELHILLAHVEGPDALPQVANGRSKKGQNGADRHRRAELGKAQRPDVAVEVSQSQRLGNPAEVLEEHHPFGQVREPPVLFRGQPGGYKVLYLPRLIQEADDALARPGQGAGAVQHPLEHRIEVEALVDAQAGLAEAGQPVPQLRNLPRLIVCLCHCPPRIGLTTAMSRPHPPRRAGCGVRRPASPIIVGPGKTHNKFGTRSLDSHSYLTDVLVKCGVWLPIFRQPSTMQRHTPSAPLSADACGADGLHPIPPHKHKEEP